MKPLHLEGTRMKSVILGCVLAISTLNAPAMAQEMTFDADACETHLLDPALAPHPLKCESAENITDEPNRFVIVFDVDVFETMKFDQNFRSGRAMENTRLHQVGP
jgi:hypothetical protein